MFDCYWTSTLDGKYVNYFRSLGSLVVWQRSAMAHFSYDVVLVEIKPLAAFGQFILIVDKKTIVTIISH